MEQKKNKFLVKYKENGDFNQYWYSQITIEFLRDQVQKHGKVVAFLSTPSIFFSLNDDEIKKNSYLFEIDRAFGKNNPNFVYFDFKNPTDFDQKYENFFDFVLIDPPFITRDVWSKFAETAKYIIKKDKDNKIEGKILSSSIDENQEMLDELLGLKIRKFRPLIPNLVYQYSLYSNYEDEQLDQENPEVQF
ncbi:hypothetical protein PPERSA_01203 [Pseudocohnilembus persalinus]|uniref:N6-adenine methyltransferase n=1 Tax=Pseudocohnilembus persalinus TaxID=266149 RepID=A0A0V0QBG7_PSEPJ|nr:hypothetical protein PPERSA_01203 [Pseudocohnilembus persalinus]|eukprot:KRW99557.1 hypothetical protein PPERSA_01203 [Pseudocohnilembus persalinus]